MLKSLVPKMCGTAPHPIHSGMIGRYMGTVRGMEKDRGMGHLNKLPDKSFWTKRELGMI